jgi:hypothetical protein
MVNSISDIGGGPPLTVSPEDSPMFRHNDGIEMLDWIEEKLLQRNIEDVFEGNPIPFQLMGTISGVCRDARKAFVEKQSFTLSIDYRYEARSIAGPHLLRAKVHVDEAIPVIVLD